MAITFNQATVAAEPNDAGVARQRLVTDERVKGTGVLLDRLTLKAGATMRLEAPAKSLVWFQLLDGEATLKSVFTDRLSNAHSVLLPAGFNVTLSTDKGVSLLYAELADAARFDPAFAADPPPFAIVDWTRELVFKCETDERKRVIIVGPKTCGTHAMLVEMVIYPPGAMSSTCHHEGTGTLMYVLNGRGMVRSSEGPLVMRPGDLFYFPDREPHALKADSTELRFLEIAVPGAFKTVWADPGKMSRWVSTDCNIRGGRPSVDEKEHQAYGHMFGSPLIR